MMKVRSLSKLMNSSKNFIFQSQKLSSSSDKPKNDDHDNHDVGYTPSYTINQGPYPFPIPHEHHHTYDFRDDHEINDELSFKVGHVHGVKWKFPYEGKDEWKLAEINTYNPYDKSQAFQPKNIPNNYHQTIPNHVMHSKMNKLASLCKLQR